MMSSEPTAPVSTARIRIMLVDDHMVLRMGLVTATGDQADMEVVADVDNGHAALAAYPLHRPDVVIMDLRMHRMSGMDTIVALRKEHPEARILVFSNYVKSEEIYQAIRAGACGFVSKEMPLDRLLEAIRAVHAGHRYLPPEVAVRMGERLMAQLSPRELDVLRLVGRGMSNKEIGAELKVVEGTVKIHVANMLSKLGVSDRTQAIVVGVKRGLIQID